MTVLVTGATGFLGRQVVRQLLDHNYQVRCLVRSPGRERIFPPDSVDVYYGDITDADALASACQGIEQVIHLVAIIREGRGNTFDSINRGGVENMVAAAKAGGSVKQFIQVSAVGAANDPSFPYLFSKWQGEQVVVNSGLPYTILRPSIIFGAGDEFLNSLASLVRLFPLVPVIASGRNRLQPIAVEDVAQCVVRSVGRGDLLNRAVDIGGPEQLRYNEIVGIVAGEMGKSRLRIHIPVWLMWPGAALMEKTMARPPITREMLRMIRVRNVAERGVVEETFGFTPQLMKGNIDFVNSVSFGDALKMNLGLMPSHIRDH